MNNKTQLIIGQYESELLKKHLKDSKLSEFNKEKLIEELKNAHIMADEQIPEDVIRLNSEVEIEELASKKKYTFTVVLPSQANINRNRVSVFAPIGIALLGYQKGAQIQWEMPNGLRQFLVLSVFKSLEKV